MKSNHFVQSNEIHILALNETVLDESVFDTELDIDHFNLIREDKNRYGSGVGGRVYT